MSLTDLLASLLAAMSIVVVVQCACGTGDPLSWLPLTIVQSWTGKPESQPPKANDGSLERKLLPPDRRDHPKIGSDQDELADSNQSIGGGELD
jgi:hypothetical protein